MTRSKQDRQLEHILITIARDYRLPLVPPGWQQPGDLQIPLHVMAERMLHYAVMVVVGDRHGHSSESLRAALAEFARLHGRLYDQLAQKLYPTQSGQRLDASYYEADDFLVVVLTADVAPVLETMGQIVAPFVIQHQRQPTPHYRELRQLAHTILTTLYADPEPQMRDSIIERIEPMLAMQLRLLPLLPPSPSLPDSLPAEMPAPEPQARESMSPDQLLDEEYAPDTGDYTGDQEKPPAQQAARRQTLRAPLPYWDIKSRKE